MIAFGPAVFLWLPGRDDELKTLFLIEQSFCIQHTDPDRRSKAPAFDLQVDIGVEIELSERINQLAYFHCAPLILISCID